MASPTTYASFLVRMWRERDSERLELVGDWHSEVEHIQSGQRWTFCTLDETLGFLRRQADALEVLVQPVDECTPTRGQGENHVEAKKITKRRRIVSAQRILTSTLVLVLLLALVVGLSVRISPIAEAKAQEPRPHGAQSLQAAPGTAVATALSTSFTYQGHLADGGGAVNATCDFQFGLYDATSSGAQIGSTQSANGVDVSDGQFSVQLDFGDTAFQGDARWLEIAVRCPAGGGSYSALTPRQALTPAPYALALPGLRTQQNITSTNLIGGYSGNRVAEGTVGATISGGGSNGHLNEVTADYATIGGGEHVSVTGQAATVAGGAYITATGNYAAVSGGRYNTTSETIATVGGGYNNEASGYAATVGGGSYNTASGWYATVGGGSDNTAQGQYSFAAGRRAKANHDGAFVWADSSDVDFSSTANDQFAVSTDGGAWFTGYSDSAPLLQATQSGSNDALYVAQYGDGRAGFLGINNTGNSNPALQVTTNGSGDYILAGSSSEPDFRVLNTGEVRSDVGFNTPANDFAEMMTVEGDPANYEPGDVLVISSTRDRAVGLSSTPYARAVIGVYSTAPGFVGGRSASDDDQANSVPVAILGIVPCKVSAENGPIYRGSLLVTSSTPGHAMRTDAPPVGTVLGKALEPLDTGTGVILILVTLQ